MLSDVIRIKRRSTGGEPGPPLELAASEIAYNEADDVLYYGKGDDDGRATEIVAIGGAAAMIEIAALRDEIGKLKGTLNTLTEALIEQLGPGLRL